MISVSDLSVVPAEKVPPGTLVLCDTGSGWDLALRIETPGDDAGERIGLLQLRAEVRHLSPFGVRPHHDQSGVKCIVLGIPVIQADVRSIATAVQPSSRLDSGRLRITRNGLAIQSYGFQFGSRAWWNVTSGAHDRGDTTSLELDRWELGLRQPDGAISVLLRYPEDYLVPERPEERAP